MRLLRHRGALCAVLITLLLTVQSLAAQMVTAPSPAHSTIYGGLGPAEKVDPTVSHTTPWTVGFTYQPAARQFYIGLDFAGEGTSHDNTSNQNNTIEQALSLNAIVGLATPIGSHMQVGGGVLLGGRRVGLECADSYLGYQCYADQDPTPHYVFNVGGLAHLTVGHLFLGMRATTVSRQGLIGFSF